ncbi:MAG: 6-bladed beta-propeller [Tannerella sp.]|nr:6-bladed beta-propeller [Tannerella sp.]
MNKLLCLLIVILLSSCLKQTDQIKRFNVNQNIFNVQERVKEIRMEDVLIHAQCALFLAEDYLIIGDYNSTQKQAYIFNKENFEYLMSFADRGPGPREITSMGQIVYNTTNRKLYISDHGKECIYSYDIDSVLTDSQYSPTVKMKMNNLLFPDKYQYINDTLSMGKVIARLGNSEFNVHVGKWNMNTGEIKLMQYEHPGIIKKRISFAASVENGIYVECYSNYDLMTICNMNGELICNIYGQRWNNFNTKIMHFFDKVEFCNDKIIASYSGGDYYSDEYYPTKFTVFDTEGNYIKTLETGYKIVDFCIDKTYNRILMTLDSEMQFAYLDLDGIL